MLLRRITQHVKDQNWFAVLIDFIIVVVGVFIGIQVANWNEAKSDARRFDQQLISFQEELETNLEILERYKARSEIQISEINEIRLALSGDIYKINPTRFKTIMHASLAVPSYQYINAAYNDLAESGRLRDIAGTPLRQAILHYERHLLDVHRNDRDALNFRDQIYLPFVMSEMSLAAMVIGNGAMGELIRSYGFVPTQFASDIAKAAQSRELDNNFALVFAMEVEKLESAIRLQAATKKLIALLGEEH